MSNVWKIPSVDIEALIEKTLDYRHRATKEFALELAVQLFEKNSCSPRDVTKMADHFMKWLEAGEAKEVDRTE